MIRTFGHIGITVGDFERSLRFYRDVLELEVARTMEMAGGGRIVFLSIHGHGEIELFGYPSPQPMPEAVLQPRVIGFKHLALRVEDMEGAVAWLKAKGVAFDSEPTPERRRAVFRDPDGLPIELTMRAPTPPASR